MTLNNTKKIICALVIFLPAWTLAALPEVDLAKLPLNNNQGNVHPNVLLNLSVELPTVGAAYRNSSSYDGSTSYVGYFNPEKCYSYPGTNATLVDYHTKRSASFTVPKLDDSGYFSIAGPTAANHQCNGSTFSGNFLNWASASAIDMMRYALTGGDRIVDSFDITVLQRAFLHSSFYANARYFPRKSISGSLVKTVTPFNSQTLYIVNCDNKILFSDTQGGGFCDSARYNKSDLLKTDKFFGEYLVRVKVCDRIDSLSRPNFCFSYGNAYKPVGQMQLNHKTMRFSAMGYLLDNNKNHYGGVLRAPMKHIGEKTVEAPNFNESKNERMEWDPATGILYSNPEFPAKRNSLVENSGVINYLNKFGRTGNYKSNDPVSELFYEGIRYLQGKQPTPEAISNITTEMKDNFPVITQWQDPNQLAKCQKNYAIYTAGTAYWANTPPIRLDQPTRVKSFIVDIDDNSRNQSTISIGAPDNYFLASQPGAMISAFKKVFSTINNSIGTNSGVTLSSPKITDTPFAFQPGFDSATWSGSLRKLAIIQNSDGAVAISNEAQWDAGKLLTTSQTPANRTIATYNSLTRQTVLFDLGNLPTEIQTLFNLAPGTQNSDNLGLKRISYLAGNRKMESRNVDPAIPQFRIRESVLGDIINSAPVYVGAPAKNTIGSDYQLFYNQNKTRAATVFAGANDGMLHAFSADSGTEFFAYIPGPLLKKLPNLTDVNYQHDPTMDGNIRVSEAQVSGAWKTVLAAGMGAGAKGIFALDVTSPDKFMEGHRALFEFTEQDDPDIGHITSTPLIAKVSIGKNSNGTSNYGYFVIVTSGYNSANNIGDQFLYLLSLDKNPTAPWIVNTNYYKLSTGTRNTATANALSSPGLALNVQGAAVYAYSGDLQGNVWRFDFTGDNPSSVTPKIIFTAKDRSDNAQSITAQPMVAFAPDGGYLVLVGTGKYVENADTAKENFKQNSFYALRDSKKNAKEDYFIAGRAQLATRELVKKTVNGRAGFEVTGESFTYGNGTLDKKGWFIDYPNGNATGERSISEGLIGFGKLFFNTIIPNVILCDDTVRSVSYMVNLLTGKSTSTDGITGFMSRAGMLGVPVLMHIGSTVGKRDALGRRNNATQYSVINFGTGGMNGSSEVIDSESVAVKAGRLSWREISNWLDIK